MAALLDRAGKALLFARTRVRSGLAAPRTEARLEELERFEHPLAPRLARALRRVRERDHSTLLPWIWRIEQERARLLARREKLEARGPGLGPYDQGLTVHDACLASRRLHDAVALYLLVRELGPSRVLELGTNVGISGAYVVGLFDKTLESALAEPVDFVFIDGHHQYEPTLDYFDRIWKHSTENAVFVFDDIRWSRGMERAWQRLQSDPRLSLVVDLSGLGIGVATRTPKTTGRLVTPILSI